MLIPAHRSRVSRAEQGLSRVSCLHARHGAARCACVTHFALCAASALAGARFCAFVPAAELRAVRLPTYAMLIPPRRSRLPRAELCAVSALRSTSRARILGLLAP
ncbi:hypothetical protein FB451DRAFT_1400665 [Mycena latifolia]|nr:hypothetical protein FB451DRAFT_1400665 [Mycena latifolia]